MNVESDLKKDGIEILSKLDTLKVNSIARNVSIKLCKTFPNFNLNQNELFMKLSRLDMYIAKMPKGMAEASYFYKNSTIYFNKNINFNDLEKFAIHECIHHIQEIKDNKNYLVKMGLCDYTELKVYGLGLNEAAVQLISAKVLNAKKELVKYFNISLETTSPSYYPLECCLVNQLGFIVGEEVLFESTINSNDNFKYKFIELTNYKTFMRIQNYIDKILNNEEEIIKINNKIANFDNLNKKVTKLINKTNFLKQNITSTFFKAQNLIISSYFDKQLNLINNLEQIENYRRKLYTFKDYLGSTENYTYFNDYYVSRMIDLEDKHNMLENKTNNSSSLYLVPNRKSKISVLFKYIKNILLRLKLKQPND